MKVNILMSTYNGQQFLSEQICSIKEQSYTDWTLFIRDDGSSDNTKKSLRILSVKIVEFILLIVIRVTILEL